MNPQHSTGYMGNLNIPRIVSADKLTEEELDEAIARAPRPFRVPQPLPPMQQPMDYLPQWYADAHAPEAAHAASEVDDDEDLREPLSRRERLLQRVLAWASLLIVIGCVAWALR